MPGPSPFAEVTLDVHKLRVPLAISLLIVTMLRLFGGAVASLIEILLLLVGLLFGVAGAILI